MSKNNIDKLIDTEETIDTGVLFHSEKIYPSISILLPVNKKYPQFKEEELKLKGLIKKAEEKLRFELSKKMADSITEKLHKTISTIDFTHLSESLAIFVSSSVQKVVHLSFPVEEKVIIGRSFEVRDLLFAAKNNFHFILLTISENRVGYYQGYDHHLEKVENKDFPFGINDVGGDSHSRVQNFNSFASSRDASDQNEFHDKQLLKYLRDIDSELTKIIKQAPVPVVICGVEKEISKFKNLTKNKDSILGYIEGNFDHLNETAILKTVEPLFAEKKLEDEKKTLALLDEAVGKRTFASGVQDVWKAVMEKRGRLLVVEKDYRYMARIGNNKFTLVTTGIDENDVNVSKDIVDDIMEYVFFYGGDVAFVSNGALADHSGIALITYYV